jgi:hypothetical protein
VPGRLPESFILRVLVIRRERRLVLQERAAVAGALASAGLGERTWLERLLALARPSDDTLG